MRPVARALEILRVDLESAPSSCWGAPPSRNWMRSYVEIVYILEGSAILEAEGKPPVTLKAGEAFTTVANEVHNVKNASSSAPGKALAFYIAKKGTRLEELSRPAK